MKNFTIYTNPYKDEDDKITNRIKDYLLKIGANICDKEANDAITIVLGGDGTMLRAIREIHSEGPFVGVNLGNLGFLTEIELENIEDSLYKLYMDDYVCEKRMLLESEVVADGKKVDMSGILALNDVVLARAGSLKILSFDIYVNGTLLHEYLADGMIISTPTGSTGYNLSAGGPIASPASEVIMLTPICPHSLNQRSIILSGDDEIEINIPLSKDKKPQEMEISFDGSNNQIIKTGDSFKVRRSSRHIQIARLGKDSFLDVLNRKMREK